MKTITKFIFIIALLFTLNEYSQSQLVVDGTINNVSYTGAAQDFIFPIDPNVAKLKFTMKGGDGGKMEEDLIIGSCKAKGGVGATTTATFAVGDDVGQIPPGSTVRFVVGGKGETGDQPGGGGGGSAVLYKAPTSGSTWKILAVAGGGGGGLELWIIVCLSQQHGQGGQAGTSGGNGNGDIAPGSGGTVEMVEALED